MSGSMTGARALVETLLSEGVPCVFGIPGAQENELWDEMKSRGLGYLLVTHEFSAACMADGVSRSTGRPGVICIVPGPGLTNALTGIGEALLDSVPMVCIVGDVARGDKYKPFQVHELPQVGLLQQVTKGVFDAATRRRDSGRRPAGVPAGPARRTGADRRRRSVQPVDRHARFYCPPSGPPRGAVRRRQRSPARCSCCAIASCRVGIYAGLGCMDYTTSLDEGRGDVAGAGRHQRLRQGRHRRVPSAGRRLGLRAAGNAHRRERLQGRRCRAGRSASATARSPPAFTPSRRIASSTSTPTRTTWAESSRRRSASTPTPASSSTACWRAPTRWAGRATRRWPAASASGNARTPRSIAAATPAAAPIRCCSYWRCARRPAPTP